MHIERVPISYKITGIFNELHNVPYKIVSEIWFWKGSV